MSQEVVDWNKLTAPKLKEELKKRGLPQTGNKSDLVSRLQQDDAEKSVNAGEEESEDVTGAEGEETEDQAEVYEEANEGEGEEEINENANEGEEMEGDGAEGEEENNGGGEAEHEGEGEQGVEGEEGNSGEGEGEKSEETSAATADEDEKKKKAAEIEEQYKQIEKDFFIDMPRESDIMTLTWNGKKFTVPFVSEVHKDLSSRMKGVGFMVYPLELSDIWSDLFTRLVNTSLKFSISFFERSAVKTTNGSAKFVFETVEEATKAQDELKAFKESLTFEDLKFDYKESEEDFVPAPVKLPASSTRPIAQRLLFVGSLPSDVTEPTLRELFPDALRVIIPHKGNEESAENTERNRYAYIEYETEEGVAKAAGEHKEATLSDEKLFVIPAMSVRKERFGLLSNTLRQILIDKTRKLKRIVKNPYNKSSSELKEMEKSIAQNIEKLNKDAEHRESWGMPLGRLESSKVDEEDPNPSATHRGVRGGVRKNEFRGRGGPRGGNNMQRGGRGGNTWSSPQRGGYGGGYNSGGYNSGYGNSYNSGSGFGGGAGGYRRGGGSAGGYFNQSFGSPGFAQQFNTGYNNYSPGGFGSGYGGMKRRAEDNLQGGGDWKRARGGRGRFF